MRRHTSNIRHLKTKGAPLRTYSILRFLLTNAARRRRKTFSLLNKRCHDVCSARTSHKTVSPPSISPPQLFAGLTPERRTPPPPPPPLFLPPPPSPPVCAYAFYWTCAKRRGNSPASAAEEGKSSTLARKPEGKSVSTGPFSREAGEFGGRRREKTVNML